MTKDEDKKALEAQKQKDAPAGGAGEVKDIVVGEETQQAEPAGTVTTPTEKPNSAVPYLDKLIESSGKQVADHPRQEKLERTQAMIGGIADMGRALSNLYFTTQHAPNAYENGMSEKMRERMEKAKAQRAKDRDAWMNYVLQKGKIEESEKALALKKKQAETAAENAKKAREDLNAYRAAVIEGRAAELEEKKRENQARQQEKERQSDQKDKQLEISAKNAETNARRVTAYENKNNGKGNEKTSGSKSRRNSGDEQKKTSSSAKSSFSIHK